jgi:hypothetical protein
VEQLLLSKIKNPRFNFILSEFDESKDLIRIKIAVKGDFLIEKTWGWLTQSVFSRTKPGRVFKQILVDLLEDAMTAM